MASNYFYDSDDDDVRPPYFNGKEYYYWKTRMQVFVKANDYDAWKAIRNGPFIPTHIVDAWPKPKPIIEWTNDDDRKAHPDCRAMHYISCALSKDQFGIVMNCETAQEMWNKLRDIHEGTGEVKMARIAYLTREYEGFFMKRGESIHDMEIRFYDVVNHLDSLGKKIPNEDLVNKVLRCLSKNWRNKVRTIETSRDFSTMHLVSLFCELRWHELQLNRLDENDEIHKKKKNNGHVAVSSRKDDEEDDNDDSKGKDISGTRPPYFNGNEYYIWKSRMQIYVKAIDFDAWKAIKNGPFIPTHIVDDLPKPKPKSEWTDDDAKKAHPDCRAIHYIFCALSKGQFGIVRNCETAQEMWNKLQNIHEGTGELKMARIGYLTREYEVFCLKRGESIHDMEMRFYSVVNHLASLGKKIPNEDLVKKVLRCLSVNWRHKVRTIRKSRDFSTMLLVSLFSELRLHELELNRLEENDEMHKKKKNNGCVAASSRKDDEVDSDDSEDMEIKDLCMLLKKNNV